MYQKRNLIPGQVIYTSDTGAAGYKANLHGTLGDNILNLFPAVNQITKIIFWHCPKHDFHIGQTKIRIKNNDTLPHPAQTDRQVYRRVGLADSTLAAGDGYHPCVRIRLLIF